MIVVALHKAGTHLIAKLLRELGFETYGEGLDNLPPPWTAGSPDAFGPAFIRDFPKQTAFFFHSLPLELIPMQLTDHWRKQHRPPILFHYRDPRAVLYSLINYLLGRSVSETFSGSPWQAMLSDLLHQLEPQEHLNAVMQCQPDYIRNYFGKNVWLLRHPLVCKTSFERLVGARGGGNDSLQAAEIDKVTQFLGIHAKAEQVADRLFDPTQRTFFRGRIDAWKSAFGADEHERFNALYGDLLQTYGYADDSPYSTI